MEQYALPAAFYPWKRCNTDWCTAFEKPPGALLSSISKLAALPISRSVAKTLNGPSIPSAAAAMFSTADLNIARPAFLQRVLAVASRLFCSAFANFTAQKEGLNTMRNRICRRSSIKCTTIATEFSLSGALFCVSDRRHALGQKRLSCPDKSTHAAGPNLK